MIRNHIKYLLTFCVAVEQLLKVCFSTVIDIYVLREEVRIKSHVQEKNYWLLPIVTHSIWRIKLHPHQLICLFEFPENVLSKNQCSPKVLVSNSVDTEKFKCYFVQRISGNGLVKALLKVESEFQSSLKVAFSRTT